MDKLAVACGREFLMGVVARVLTDEPDLFSFNRIPMDRGIRPCRFPDGHCSRLPDRFSEPAFEEELERWDGMS